MPTGEGRESRIVMSVSLAVSLVLGTAGLAVALALLGRIFVNVGAMEIAVKERRYVGRAMPAGRVVAMEGEIGIQAEVLKPGLHLVGYPFERVVRKMPLVEIASDEIGIVEAVDGAPMPAGRAFAPDRARHAHADFQDPAGFIKHGGVKGIQLRTLPPGLWPIHPYLFRVSIAKAVVVPAGKVGVVIAADGDPVDAGRVLARAVTGHRTFSDAEEFILSGGQRGEQVEVLPPGTHRLHTESIALADGRRRPGLFSVELRDAAPIDEGEVGVVEAPAAPWEWTSRAAAAEVADTFDLVDVNSSDGYAMRLEVRVVLRVSHPRSSVDELKRSVVRPLVDSTFRNQAS